MHQTVCPSCGYCPTCGRKNATPSPWNTPYAQPWNNPYTIPYNPWWQQGGSITIKQPDTYIGDPPNSGGYKTY